MMSDDYLWNGSGKPDAEVECLERLLGRLRHEKPAPDFSRVVIPRSLPRRRYFLFGLTAAAALLLAALVWIATRPSEGPWSVARLAGSPRVGSQPLRDGSRLGVGEWLETDVRSRARIEIGRIGSVEVEPGTRLRVLEASPDEHRLDLVHGAIHARTWAPPRLFYMNTPSAVAVDLGCAYSLEVDASGAGLLRVTSGWVSLELDGRESRVPAGAACETRPGRGPGTPFFEDGPPALRRALATLDFEAPEGTADSEALDTVLGAARSRDGLTLWYLLSRAEGEDARRLYDRLAALVPPPAGVTREGVLGGSRHMLSLWWDRLGLEPSPWWKKKLTRLRDLTRPSLCDISPVEASNVSTGSERPKGKEQAMKSEAVRVLVVAAVMVAAGAGAMALLSQPADANSGGFQPCPVPPCAAPCVLGAQPDVVCKLANGGTEKTTFACCCCGGGGNSFKRLK